MNAGHAGHVYAGRLDSVLIILLPAVAPETQENQAGI
jgi:hypothetical protein